MKISVIICTKDRTSSLLQCLASIDAAARHAGSTNVEIVVLDNGSNDNTSAEVRSWASNSYLPVVLEYEALPGLAIARNRGARVASGDLFVMVDDDCIVRKDYFVELLRIYPDSTEQVLRGGRVERGNPEDLALTIKTDTNVKRWHLDIASARTENLGNCVLGCNLLMSRAIYIQLGPFDEKLGAGSPIPAGEDTDYIFRAYEAGVAIEYVPDLVVFHHHGRKTAAEARKLWQNYMVGSGALYAKHLFKCPSLCLQAKWDLRGAIREIVSGKNLFLPEYNFSYIDKLSCYASGAGLYIRAITKRKPR